MRTLIVVPARRGSRRLADKMLRKLCGRELVLWSYESALNCARAIGYNEAGYNTNDLGNGNLNTSDSVDVVVACDDLAIARCVEAAGGRAIMTSSELASGSDRVWSALCELERKHNAENISDSKGDSNSGENNFRYDTVINYQGDLPRCPSDVFSAGLAALSASGADIATPIVAIDESVARRADVVKAIFASPASLPATRQTTRQTTIQTRRQAPRAGNSDKFVDGADTAWYRAMTFTRAFASCSDDGADASLRQHHQHIGIYIYKRAALERFVSLPPSRLEQRERLEQLRALENGLTIAVFPIASAPIEINLATDMASFEESLEESFEESLEQQLPSSRE